jgi:hypothetical protein
MVYTIFEIKTEDAGKINKVTTDDTVSRQSILTRDSSSIGLKGSFLYLKIEGSDQGIKKAEELAKEQGFKKLDNKKAKKINDKIAEQEDSAASGMGMIFD